MKETRLGRQRCNEWLLYCLSIGYNKSQLNDLEKAFWKYKDRNGNLKKPRKEQKVQECDELKGRLSERGLFELGKSKKKGIWGKVTGSTRDGQCIKIMWPGSKTSNTYHKSFIEVQEIDKSTLP